MKRSDWILLAIPGVIWGTSFLFIAEGLRAIGPNGVTFVRILIGFATWRSSPRPGAGSSDATGRPWRSSARCGLPSR